MSKTAKWIAYLVLGLCLLGFGYVAWRSAQMDTAAAPAPGSTNQAASSPDDTALRPPSQRLGRLITFGALAFFSMAGLSILIARDASHFFAHRVERFIFNEDLEGVKDPEYEEAERVWANGQHLEAIQLMRDYLKERPLEQYVALRIAEIYEKDLGNPVAAALEYEEILEKKLPAERWGWAAIHLANLYSGKLNRVAHAEALLHRIVNEYGQTAAARKARERLGIADPEVAAAVEAQAAAAAQEPDAEQPVSNLPPGFRPKKG